jgi:hypothetical protein
VVLLPAKCVVSGLLIVMILMLVSTAVSAETLVSFQDANLEDAIRHTLREWDKPLSTSDLAKLRILEAQKAGIRSLSGLEHAVNLKRVNLSGNEISDLGPLAGLTGLESLNLKWNNVSSIAPLRRLTNLIYLGLEHNNISDISPLAGLTQLVRLNLGQNRIRDISPLRNLTNLEQLVIYFNDIRDVSALSGLTGLQVLNLSDNLVSNINPLVVNLDRGGLKDVYINLENNSINPDDPALGKFLNVGAQIDTGWQSISKLSPGTTALPEPVEIKVPRTARQNGAPVSEETETEAVSEPPQLLPTEVNERELRLMQGLMVFGVILILAIMYLTYKLGNYLLQLQEQRKQGFSG